MNNEIAIRIILYRTVIFQIVEKTLSAFLSVKRTSSQRLQVETTKPPLLHSDQTKVKNFLFLIQCSLTEMQLNYLIIIS